MIEANILFFLDLQIKIKDETGMGEIRKDEIGNGRNWKGRNWNVRNWKSETGIGEARKSQIMVHMHLLYCMKIFYF